MPNVLIDFGLPPKKARTPLTVQEKAAAVAKNEATRLARHTMGSRQRAAIHGDVIGVTVTPIVAASPAPAAAQSPASPPAAQPAGTPTTAHPVAATAASAPHNGAVTSPS